MISDVHELARLVNGTGMGLKSAYKAGLLPASDKTISKQLKKGGYDYDTSTKQWVLTSSDIAATTAHDTQSELLPAPTVMLNNDELTALKQLAQQIISGNMNVTAYAGDAIELYERTRSLEKGERDRKTYVVDKALSQQFDELAARVNLDKSDLLALALTDFIQRYNNA